MQCLPTPSQAFFDSFKEIIMEFLWEGKTPKIRYDKLILSYEDGGLKLVHLPTKY